MHKIAESFQNCELNVKLKNKINWKEFNNVLIKNAMEINKELVDKTIKCQKSFDCLNNDKHVFCKVELCANDKVHFVKCSDNHSSYRMSFGYSDVCNCEIRKEIFNKYNIWQVLV